MTRSRMYTVIGTLGIVLLLLASYLFVISPRMAKASEIKENTAAVQAQTQRLEDEIARLLAVQADLPAKTKELAGMTAAVPRTAEIPSALEQMRGAAARAGVTVEGLKADPPAVVAPVATPTESGAPADSAAAAEDTTTSRPATTGTQPGVGLSGTNSNVATMKVTMSVSGNYGNLSVFLKGLETMPRAYFMENAKIATDSGKDATGRLKLTVEGTMFVMIDGAGTGKAATPTPTPSPAA